MTPSIPGGAEIQHLMKSSLIFLAIEGIVKSFLNFFVARNGKQIYLYASTIFVIWFKMDGITFLFPMSISQLKAIDQRWKITSL